MTNILPHHTCEQLVAWNSYTPLSVTVTVHTFFQNHAYLPRRVFENQKKHFPSHLCCSTRVGCGLNLQPRQYFKWIQVRHTQLDQPNSGSTERRFCLSAGPRPIQKHLSCTVGAGGSSERWGIAPATFTVPVTAGSWSNLAFTLPPLGSSLGFNTHHIGEGWDSA